jgi:hypothetical protein
MVKVESGQATVREPRVRVEIAYDAAVDGWGVVCVANRAIILDRKIPGTAFRLHSLPPVTPGIVLFIPIRPRRDASVVVRSPQSYLSKAL